MKVHKQRLAEDGVSVVEIPAGHQVLAFDRQHGTPTIWFLVDDSSENTLRAFEVVATGRDLESESIDNYVGSADTRGGGRIAHCFEVPVPMQEQETADAAEGGTPVEA